MRYSILIRMKIAEFLFITIALFLLLSPDDIIPKMLLDESHTNFKSSIYRFKYYNRRTYNENTKDYFFLLLLAKIQICTIHVLWYPKILRTGRSPLKCNKRNMQMSS